MRPIAGTDIIDFHTSGYDLLILTADGEFAHIDYSDITNGDDGRATAYDFVQTDDGEVQILLEARTITDGEWFPDALDDDGDLTPSAAQEMANVITNDGILAGQIAKAQEAGRAWKQKADVATLAALARAQAVETVVDLLDGNQSAAARALRLNQSTVNRLVRKAREGARIMVPACAIPDDWPVIGEVVKVGEETTVVELDNGRQQELPNSDITLV